MQHVNTTTSHPLFYKNPVRVILALLEKKNCPTAPRSWEKDSRELNLDSKMRTTTLIVVSTHEEVPYSFGGKTPKSMSSYYRF